MKTVRRKLCVLIIEDNPGDFALVEEFLLDQVPELTVIEAKNYEEAREVLCEADCAFDVVLLDLSLPDKTGVPLIKEIVELSKDMPVIVLTGYTDLAFGVNSLALGVSDYVLKEELNPALLLKSILYSMERKKVIAELQASEKQYSELFHLSPQPMYVLDAETLCFLDANAAAVKFYGYRREEFLEMNIRDICPTSETIFAAPSEEPMRTFKGYFTHRKSNGKLRKVDIKSNQIDYKGKKAIVALTIDMTARINYIKAIELQNKKLREISWVQSHVVRAPLARILGLVELFKISGDFEEKERMLDFLMISANELDTAIREITNLTTMKSNEIVGINRRAQKDHHL